MCPTVIRSCFPQCFPENNGNKINIRLSSNCCGQVAIQSICVSDVGWDGGNFGSGTTKKNSMDSEPMDASKNACLQQSSYLTKPSHLMCQCGWKFGFVEGTWQVKWESLWETLSEHGVSDHMLWVLKRMYHGQKKLNTTVLMENCFVSGEACNKDVY